MVRPVQADRVGDGLSLTVEANGGECDAIALRLRVPSVQSLHCAWVLRPGHDGTVEANGSLRAQLHQECVVSLDAFPTNVVEEFAVRFVPAGRESAGADDPDEPDELLVEDGVLELGEATVEQLALALDPYPRKLGAELPAEGVEASGNPFAALARLRSRE